MSSLEADGTIHRSRAEELRELASDLSATWDARSIEATVSSWMSRPSILRRLADALGERIDGGIDRVVALGPGAQALASAVGLATGIPFRAEGAGGAFGDIHAGERVSVVSAIPLPDAEGEPRETDVVVAQRLSILAPAAGAGDDGRTSLFALGDGDALSVLERNPS